MKKIYLVRHGQSQSNVGGKLTTNKGVELTDVGHEQAQTVCQWLIENVGTDIISIGVSKFIRTQQTAKPLVEATHIQPTVIDGLEEFNYLSFDNVRDLPLTERLEISDNFWLNHDIQDAHGADSESFASFYARVQQVRAYFETLESGTHIVYTHGLWISMLIWQLLAQPAPNQTQMQKFRQFEMSIRARNCEVFCLTIAEDEFASHYPPAITQVRTRTDSRTVELLN